MESRFENLMLLKLGGSLITDKSRPKTPRMDILDQIMTEIRSFRESNPGLELIIGHGSGSFGHSAAKKFNTRDGVHTSEEWQGFFEVFRVARELNQIVYHSGINANLPLMPFPLSTSSITDQRAITNWNLTPMKEALMHGFIPLVFGDVAFDQYYGGTILSTEEIFDFLTDKLKPKRILLAGIEPGIWRDFPKNTAIIPEIHLSTWENEDINLAGSGDVDVTGGMKSKVESMLEIIQRLPDCQIQIFTGLESGAIYNALSGNNIGTQICY